MSRKQVERKKSLEINKKTCSDREKVEVSFSLPKSLASRQTTFISRINEIEIIEVFALSVMCIKSSQ